MQDILKNIPTSILSTENKKILQHALENEEPQYSLRLNPKKFTQKLKLDPVSWCENSYYVKDKPRFSMDPLWHAGAYYVQEAGSMFLCEVVKHIPFDSPPKRVLDMCAAPGGKTTLLADHLPEDCVIVANEVVPQRMKSLEENIAKWGNTNIILSRSQPREFENLPDYFDLVLIDAPCSGEGLLRRHDEALNQWSKELIEECCSRQRDILSSALETLQPGGFLIYSTCTYNTEENEKNLEWLMREKNCEPVQTGIKVAENITVTTTENNTSWRFFPGMTRSEGFFITVVRKASSSNVKHYKEKANRPRPVVNSWEHLFEVKENLVVTEEKDGIYLYHPAVWGTLGQLEKRIQLSKTGILMGSVKNAKFVPSETISFCSGIKVNDESKIELDYEAAIKYLSLQSIVVDHSTGYAFFAYEGVPLGAGNVLPNRVNNLYPKNWRILHPDMEKKFTLRDFILP